MDKTLENKPLAYLLEALMIAYVPAQAIAGLVCIGQVGVGVYFWLGQGGLGLQALMGWKGKAEGWFKELNEEMSEVLSFRGDG